MDISWIGSKLVSMRVNVLYFNDITLGGAFSLGSIIGFFVGGWISQFLGKKILMVLSNFASFIIWIMLALRTHKVGFIILERFFLGVVSMSAIVCVGEICLQRF